MPHAGDLSPPSSLLEALELAIRAEMEAFHTYRRAAADAEDPEVVALFRQLARDEARHRKLLEAQRDLTLQGQKLEGGSGLMADEQEPKDQAERGERAAERAVAVLQEANQILKEAQRLRAEAEAMMVHDFKQPLSVIIGFAETLQALGTEASTDELAEMVGIIHESGTRLLSLVTDFLDLARYEAGHVSLDLEQLDLASLVQPLVKQFAPQAVARQQKMEVNFPALPPVRADAKALTRVLSNLIENALKYTPEGSQVSLTGEYDGLFVRVVVRDNGPGVPPEDLPHLFESFYRGRGQSRASGTGLGLALSKHLIEAHGGRMGAANNESGGATFYFTLPSTD